MENGSDAQNNKWMGVLAYFIFFLPLILAKDSGFAKFHANQGLILLILVVVVNVVGGIIPIIGWFIILPLGSLFCFVLAIIGIVNAIKGEMKPLPIIGGITLLQ